MTIHPLCPECAQGKHPNCTGWALDADDREVQCMCDCQVEQRKATASWLPTAPEGAVAPTAAELAAAVPLGHTVFGLDFGADNERVWEALYAHQPTVERCIVGECQEVGVHNVIGRLPSGEKLDSPLHDVVLGLMCVKHHTQILSHVGTDFSLAELPTLTAVRACRVCGCTDDKACLPPAGPCHWVELDLCSACAPKEPTC